MKTSTLIKNINQFIGVHRKNIAKIMEADGLYFGQHPILWDLLECGPETQTELVAHLNVTAPSITNSVKRLEKNGFLTKEICKDDLRKTRVCLTEKGEKAALRCRKEFAVLDQAAFTGMEPEELEKLNEYFVRMIRNIENYDAKAEELIPET